MKEFCSKFDIIPITDIASIANNIVVPVDGASVDTLFSEVLSIDPKPDNADAGLSLSLSQDIIIDKVGSLVASKYNYPRYCVLIIYYTDGTYTIYGSIDYPVVAYITPGIQSDTLSVSLQTPVIPLI